MEKSIVEDDEINWYKQKIITVCSCHVTYAFESEGEVTATGLEPRTT